MDWPEILLIDKPTGITSFDVIRRLRKIYTTETKKKAPKLGHAGTLDPAASGLMIIGVGRGTKKLTEFIKLDKEYVAEVLIGRSTTTGDIDGKVMEEKKVEEISRSEISAIVQSLVGTQILKVSAYSAIKKDGVPMYKRAYAAAQMGEVLTEVPIREMIVYVAELLDHQSSDGLTVATLRFFVSSGTYIRSLAEELGKRLGYPASLKSLRRTKIGDFHISKAKILPNKI